MSQLREDPWFGSIPIDLAQMIIDRSVLVTLDDAGIVYERGAVSDGLYGIVRGSVRIVQLAPTGVSGIHDVKQAPSWFGELSEIDGKRRPQDAAALGAATLLHLNRTSFRRIVEDQPQAWQFFSKLLALHVRDLFERLESLTTRSARVRLAQLLMNTFVLQKKASLASEDLAMTQDTLASIVGISRQATSRILKEFEKRGAISVGYRRIDIVSSDKLKILATS